MIELQEERRAALPDADIVNRAGCFRQGIPDPEPDQHPFAALGNRGGPAVMTGSNMRFHRRPVDHADRQPGGIQRQGCGDAGQAATDNQRIAENVVHALWSLASAPGLGARFS